MRGHDIIVIGASAGGIEALIQIVRDLPADLPATVFVVVHLPSYGTSVLPHILTKAGNLPASHPTDGEKIVPGRIYVAVPDKHLLIKDGHVHVAHGPRENRQRPAIDPLFRTAAMTYGPRVIGVVLSGNLDDGTAGLRAIKARGGLAVVQDPDNAIYQGMPQSAVENVPDIDAVLPIDQIGQCLIHFAEMPALESSEPVNNLMEQEVGMSELDPAALGAEDRPGDPSGFACPDCGGVLFELSNGEYLRFRCRVGHAYSPETLVDHQQESLDNALWVALRALEENAALSRRLAERAENNGHAQTMKRFREREEESEQNAEVIRRLILSQGHAGGQATD